MFTNGFEFRNPVKNSSKREIDLSVLLYRLMFTNKLNSENKNIISYILYLKLNSFKYKI